MTSEPEVNELLAAAEQFTVPLRMGQGMDDIALGRLRDALRQCEDAWRDRDTVPKVGANVLVDLYLAVDASSYLYEDDYQALVRDAAIEISDLVRACVALPPGFML